MRLYKAGGLKNLLLLTLLVITRVTLFAEPPSSKKDSIIAADYSVFLNSVASSDPEHLYDNKMGSEPLSATIIRTGEEGAYHYSLIENQEKRPVSYIRETSASHFSDWLEKTSSPKKQAVGESAKKILSSNFAEDKQSIRDAFLASNSLFFAITAPNAPSLLSLGRSPSGLFANNSSLKRLEIISLAAFLGVLVLKGEKPVPSEEAPPSRNSSVEDPLSVDRKSSLVSVDVGSYLEEKTGEEENGGSYIIVDHEEHEEIDSHNNSDTLPEFKQETMLQGITKYIKQIFSKIFLRSHPDTNNGSETLPSAIREDETASSVSWRKKIYEWFANLFLKSPESYAGEEDHITETDATQSSDNSAFFKPTLTREATYNRGFLFLHSDDFQILAGEIAGNPGLFASDYTTLLDELSKYNNLKKQAAPNKAIQEKSLLKIVTITKRYLNTQKNRLQKNITRKEEAELAKRSKAAELLLRGIAVEKWCLSKNIAVEAIHFRPSQFLPFDKDSHYLPRANISDVSLASFSPQARHRSFQEENQPIFSTVKKRNSLTQREANLLGRAVASYQLAKLIGLEKLIPETDFATEEGNTLGTVQISPSGEPFYREQIHQLTLKELVQELKPYIETEIPQSNGTFYQLTEEELKESAIDTWQDFVVKTATHQGTLSPGWSLILNDTKKIPDDSEAHSSLKIGRQNIVYDGDLPISQERAKKLFQEGFLGVGKKRVITVSQKIDFSSPMLQREMSNAALFYFLTGELNPDLSNFIFEQLDDGTYTIHLVNNDISFPRDFINFSEELFKKNPGSMLKVFPRLIDATTAEQFLALTEENIRTSLANTGLTEEEIEATLSRLELLKKHINSIKDGNFPEGRLVETWNNDTYQLLKKKVDGPNEIPIDDNYLSLLLDDLETKQNQPDHYKRVPEDIDVTISFI